MSHQGERQQGERQQGERQQGGRRWRLVRAGSNAVPTSVRRALARARPRAAVSVRRAGAFLAAAAALVMVAATVAWATPLLAVSQVEVTGVDLLPPAQVRETAAVPEGTPLPRVRLDEVADRVAALAPVARVQVRRSWPRTLVVEVTERTPVAVVPQGDGYGLLDDTGTVFHAVAGPTADLPLLELATPGPDDPDTATALVVLASLTPQLHARLDTLVVTGQARIRLELSDGPVVVWGDDSASAEKAQVATALLERDADAGAGLDARVDAMVDAEVIDVSAPDVVVLR